MAKIIILNREDMLALCGNKPVTFYVDKKTYMLCTEEYFEKKLSTAFCTAGKEKK